MGKGERRTQETLVVALRVRPRTSYRPDQCVLGAKASLFGSLIVGAAWPCRGRLRLGAFVELLDQAQADLFLTVLNGHVEHLDLDQIAALHDFFHRVDPP